MMVTKAADSRPRGIWATIIMLAALIVSCATGILLWRGGANGSYAVIAAGSAFSGTAMFGFSVFEFLTEDHDRKSRDRKDGADE